MSFLAGLGALAQGIQQGQQNTTQELWQRKQQDETKKQWAEQDAHNALLNSPPTADFIQALQHFSQNGDSSVFNGLSPDQLNAWGPLIQNAQAMYQHNGQVRLMKGSEVQPPPVDYQMLMANPPDPNPIPAPPPLMPTMPGNVSMSPNGQLVPSPDMPTVGGQSPQLPMQPPGMRAPRGMAPILPGMIAPSSNWSSGAMDIYQQRLKDGFTRVSAGHGYQSNAGLLTDADGNELQPNPHVSPDQIHQFQATVKAIQDWRKAQAAQGQGNAPIPPAQGQGNAPMDIPASTSQQVRYPTPGTKTSVQINVPLTGASWAAAAPYVYHARLNLFHSVNRGFGLSTNAGTLMDADGNELQPNENTTNEQIHQFQATVKAIQDLQQSKGVHISIPSAQGQGQGQDAPRAPQGTAPAANAPQYGQAPPAVPMPPMPPQDALSDIPMAPDNGFGNTPQVEPDMVTEHAYSPANAAFHESSWQKFISKPENADLNLPEYQAEYMQQMEQRFPTMPMIHAKLITGDYVDIRANELSHYNGMLANPEKAVRDMATINNLNAKTELLQPYTDDKNSPYYGITKGQYAQFAPKEQKLLSDQQHWETELRDKYGFDMSPLVQMQIDRLNREGQANPEKIALEREKFTYKKLHDGIMENLAGRRLTMAASMARDLMNHRWKDDHLAGAKFDVQQALIKSGLSPEQQAKLQQQIDAIYPPGQ